MALGSGPWGSGTTGAVAHHALGPQPRPRFLSSQKFNPLNRIACIALINLLNLPARSGNALPHPPTEEAGSVSGGSEGAPPPGAVAQTSSRGGRTAPPCRHHPPTSLQPSPGTPPPPPPQAELPSPLFSVPVALLTPVLSSGNETLRGTAPRTGAHTPVLVCSPALTSVGAVWGPPSPVTAAFCAQPSLGRRDRGRLRPPLRVCCSCLCLSAPLPTGREGSLGFTGD